MSAVLRGPKDFRIEEVDVPTVGDRGVLVRITVCGVNTSRVRYYTGDKKDATYPVSMSHEWVGEVLEVGAEVNGFAPGDRVAACWQRVCGMCSNCQRGLSNMCLVRWSKDGSDRLPNNEGGFCEVGWSAPEALERIPDGLSYEEAVFSDPLACCLNGIERTSVAPGDTVAVVGMGPMGQMLAQLARLQGARVVAVDIESERLRLAERLGAWATVGASEGDVTSKVLALTDGQGADGVIVAVGSAKVSQTALTMVRDGGCVNLFGGTFPAATMTIDPNIIHYKQLKVVGSYHFTPRQFRTALQLMSRHAVDVRSLISHRLSLREVARAFEIAASREGMKIIVRVGENS